MTNIYHSLASAKDDLRRAKDHESTIRAIVEMGVATTGKNETDRRRELTVALAESTRHTSALDELRAAEYRVDLIQADIDQVESERREKEWAIRMRLAEALSGHTRERDDFDGPTIDQVTTAIQQIAQSRGTYAGVAREMLDADNTGMAERINGAGEFEEDDFEEQRNRVDDALAFSPKSISRTQAQDRMDELFA